MPHRLLPLVPCVIVLVSMVPCAIADAAQPHEGTAAGATAVPANPASAAEGSPPQEPLRTEDADGRVTIRATRITAPLEIDGRMDEAVYREIPPVTTFYQSEPHEGAHASEKTEAWVFFDERNVYIACRCWQDPARIVGNDSRRDSPIMGQHDHIAVGLDTFNDGRNGFQFGVSAGGSLRDGFITDEKFNGDWNGIYDARAGRFEGGWIAELAIPFKTLRYPPGHDQIWHLQIRRLIRDKNELVWISHISAAWGVSGLNHFSSAATLVGIEVPTPGVNLDVKPYAISRVTTDRLAVPAVRNDVDPDWGIDAKYGITKGLTADFTYNTDFAQVEVDEAQINLTRFNLVFPEKRDFFLEGQGTFDFGLGGQHGVSSENAPLVFYSRRIGLSGSRAIPVIGGARLTGKAGPWTVGAFSMATDNEPAAAAPQTGFTVLRLRRNILQRSIIGGMMTHRSESTVAEGGNTVWGLDGTLALYQNVYFSAYVSQSFTDREGDDNVSWRTQFNYQPDRYGLALDHNVVPRDFNPEIGFLRRTDFVRDFVSARFSPRPARSTVVRKWTYQGSADFITGNSSRVLETREIQGLARADFHSGDSASVEATGFYELLPEAFQIARGVLIPPGDYDFASVLATYVAGVQRRISGTASLEVGSFYDGDKTSVNYKGRLDVSPSIAFEPTISMNWVDLPQGSFTSTIYGSRAIVTVSPRMYASALVQYSSSNTSVSTNLRFRWEYRPGSELFVVYSEGRNTEPPRGIERLQSRGFVVKVNRLFRF